MMHKWDTNGIQAQMLLQSNVINHETIGYVEYFGLNMDRSILTQLNHKQGNNLKHRLFYSSCFDDGAGYRN